MKRLPRNARSSRKAIAVICALQWGQIGVMLFFSTSWIIVVSSQFSEKCIDSFSLLNILISLNKYFK